jgi:hypothetical protein
MHVRAAVSAAAQVVSFEQVVSSVWQLVLTHIPQAGCSTLQDAPLPVEPDTVVPPVLVLPTIVPVVEVALAFVVDVVLPFVVEVVLPLEVVLTLFVALVLAPPAPFELLLLQLVAVATPPMTSSASA